MRGACLIYHPFSEGGEDGGHVETHVLTAPPKLDYLQGAVGGYIQEVPGFDSIVIDGVTHPCVAYCNENCKLEQQPLNNRATRLWHHALPPGLLTEDGGIADVLCGSVIVLIGDAAFLRAL